MKAFEFLDRLFEKVSPIDALKIICTPENLEAIARGFGEGLAKGMKDE